MKMDDQDDETMMKMRDTVFKNSIQKQYYIIAAIYGCCSVGQTEVRRDCDTVTPEATNLAHS